VKKFKGDAWVCYYVSTNHFSKSKQTKWSFIIMRDELLDTQKFENLKNVKTN
jgi:hypothetical protein